METIRIIRTNTYQILVNKVAEDLFCVIFHRPLPGISMGSTLAEYNREDWAIAAAEKFPKMYDIAQQEGYSLLGDEFVYRDGTRVHVGLSLDADRSETDFRSMLMRN